MDALKTAYRAVTRQIEVTATPRFLPERSSPENGYFFWAYTITLTNLGGETVQLKTRHWRITDAQGRLQEVRGAGVVGEERSGRKRGVAFTSIWRVTARYAVLGASIVGPLAPIRAFSRVCRRP